MKSVNTVSSKVSMRWLREDKVVDVDGKSVVVG